MAQLTCPNCGSPVIAGMIFCDDCGFDLRQSAPAEAAPMKPAASQPAAEPERCPTCQHINRAGAVYCENCGTALTPSPAPSAGGSFSPSPLPVYQPPITPATPLPVKAYLAIPGTNVRLDLLPDKPEMIIGREDEISGVFPDINLEPFGAQDAGVSRRHLKIWSTAGSWVVEDLNTVNGTFLNRQRLSPNQPAALKAGDELRLGKLVLVFNLE